MGGDDGKVGGTGCGDPGGHTALGMKSQVAAHFSEVRAQVLRVLCLAQGGGHALCLWDKQGGVQPHTSPRPSAHWPHRECRRRPPPGPSLVTSA